MTKEELISAQFYAWEKRGRGWQTWDHPVELEPPFEPFPGYYLPTADDGRRPTGLSSFVEKLRGATNLAEPQSELLLEGLAEPEPAAFFDDSPLIEIQIALPTKSNANREVAERFLSSLRTTELPASFEVIGLGDQIAMQFVCRKADATLLRSNLRAYFHDARFQETNNFLIDHWSQIASAGNIPVIVDFALSHEFVIPLPANNGLSIDTLTG